MEIAKEKNIDYKPSAEARMALREYCDLKGIENPTGKLPGKATLEGLVPPPYNPNEGLNLPPVGG